MSAQVDLSFLRDSERARDSQTNHTATALRNRVLADLIPYDKQGPGATSRDAPDPDKEEA